MEDWAVFVILLLDRFNNNIDHTMSVLDDSIGRVARNGNFGKEYKEKAVEEAVNYVYAGLATYFYKSNDYRYYNLREYFFQPFGVSPPTFEFFTNQFERQRSLNINGKSLSSIIEEAGSQLRSEEQRLFDEFLRNKQLAQGVIEY